MQSFQTCIYIWGTYKRLKDDMDNENGQTKWDGGSTYKMVAVYMCFARFRSGSSQIQGRLGRSAQGSDLV